MTTSKKQYNVQTNIGKAKYCVSYHNGVSKHRDGSDFWDLHISNNKKDLAKFLAKLHSEGYTEKGICLH